MRLGCKLNLSAEQKKTICHDQNTRKKKEKEKEQSFQLLQLRNKQNHFTSSYTIIGELFILKIETFLTKSQTLIEKKKKTLKYPSFQEGHNEIK